MPGKAGTATTACPSTARHSSGEDGRQRSRDRRAAFSRRRCAELDTLVEQGSDLPRDLPAACRCDAGPARADRRLRGRRPMAVATAARRRISRWCSTGSRSAPLRHRRLALAGLSRQAASRPLPGRRRGDGPEARAMRRVRGRAARHRGGRRAGMRAVGASYHARARRPSPASTTSSPARRDFAGAGRVAGLALRSAIGHATHPRHCERKRSNPEALRHGFRIASSLRFSQ